MVLWVLELVENNFKIIKMNKLNVQTVLIVGMVVVLLTLLSKELARYYKINNEPLVIIFTTVIGIIFIGVILKIKAKVHRN